MLFSRFATGNHIINDALVINLFASARIHVLPSPPYQNNAYMRFEKSKHDGIWYQNANILNWPTLSSSVCSECDWAQMKFISCYQSKEIIREQQNAKIKPGHNIYIYIYIYIYIHQISYALTQSCSELLTPVVQTYTLGAGRACSRASRHGDMRPRATRAGLRSKPAFRGSAQQLPPKYGFGTYGIIPWRAEYMQSHLHRRNRMHVSIWPV